jgi:UDP-glucose 4-epimerase
MRIFITGASGFIGSRVLSLLEGHEVLCLVENPQDVLQTAHIRSLVGDLAQPEGWKAELEKFAPEGCLHLAWAGLPDYSLSRCRANLDSGLQLIETLVDVGIKRIVMAGSCWEYGNASGAVRENDSAIDCGLFATTKRSLHMMLESVARDCGIEYRWGRVFFVYGPGQRTTSLIPLCHAAYAQGQQPEIRNPGVAQDFIYIDDVAKGLATLTQADVGSGVFNIGSGVPTTVGSVVNRIAQHFDVPPPFSLQEPESGFWADVSEMKSVTGWQAQVSMSDGIAQTLKALDQK